MSYSINLPLNANGKVDRKLLPPPSFSTIINADGTDSLTLTPLEELLQRIFSEAFHIESPDVNMSFGQMGGTSLDAVRGLWLIRQKICNKVDAGLLFANPSIRPLARAIEPLLATRSHDSSLTITAAERNKDEDRPIPSLRIELLGILLLICQWVSPVWLAYQANSLLTLLFVPVFHLLSYVVCQRILFRLGGNTNKVDKLYSWYYYRWWFLNSMWLTNNSYWLKHLLGTPFYNYYLRLCGAKIGRHTFIYTTLIDAPWLLEVGESSFIGERVALSILSYQDQTYELHRIHIGSYCSITIWCILYDGVVMEDHVYVGPMSSITGHISTSNDHLSVQDRSLSLTQSMYQLACLLCLLFMHGIHLLIAYFVYCCCMTLSLPLPISLALSWSIWALTSFLTVLILLKFVVGSVTTGHYSLNSHYYLRKLWLRQLLISSFRHSLECVPLYDAFASTLLRWLGAHIESDVKLARFRQILHFPPNLLSMEHGVTTFGGAKLAPFEMTREGLCCIDKIQLGSEANLGNWCTIMPGTKLSSGTIVGSLTLVTPETVSDDVNSVLLGIPARKMPFVMSGNTSAVNNMWSSTSLSVHTLLFTCLGFFITKCLLITLYSSLSVAIVLIVHIILVCVVYHYSMSSMKTSSHSTFLEVITRTRQFLSGFIMEFLTFVGPYLSGTQYLVFLFRAFGAQIRSDVILPSIYCVQDPCLTTIGDHVRINILASIQVR